MELSGKPIEINGKEYISPNGYPNFAFWFDEETGKYSIANTKTNETTEPFVDELIYHEFPLETWTEDYIVVRIGDLYYLADNNGNCYFESSKDYIICRNVFVSRDKTYIITKGLKKVEPKAAVSTVKSGEYFFALYSFQSEYYLIDVYGDYVRHWNSNQKIGCTNCDKLCDYIISTYFIENNYIYKSCCLTKDFKATLLSTDSPVKVGNRSKTFKFNELHFSGHLTYQVKFFEFQGLEVCIYGRNDATKTHFFKPDGTVEEIPFKISNPIRKDDTFVYRQGDMTVIRDFNGNVIAEEKLSPKEVYQFLLMEKMLEKKSE